MRYHRRFKRNRASNFETAATAFLAIAGAMVGAALFVGLFCVLVKFVGWMAR